MNVIKNNGTGLILTYNLPLLDNERETLKAELISYLKEDVWSISDGFNYGYPSLDEVLVMSDQEIFNNLIDYYEESDIDDNGNVTVLATMIDS